MSGSALGTREPGGVGRIACSGSHQTTKHGEVSKGSGRTTACRLQKQNTVPKEPRIVFFRDQAPGTQRVLPPPRARAAPVSLAGCPRGHGSLGRYLSAQAKNSVGRAPATDPNHNLTPQKTQSTTQKGESQSKHLPTNTTRRGDVRLRRIARRYGTTATNRESPVDAALPKPNTFLLGTPSSAFRLKLRGK